MSSKIQSNLQKIVICGGHSTPAFATIEALGKLKPDLEFVWFGRIHPTEGDRAVSFEFLIAGKKSIPFVKITTGRLQPKFSQRTPGSLAKIPLGFVQAFVNLAKIKPDLILGFGGYLSVPVIISGWCLRIPSIVVEQTQKLSLANKINSLFAKKVAITWPEVAKRLPSRKVVFVGSILREEVFNPNLESAQLKNFFSKSGDKALTIFVTGGAQGSHFLNQLIEANLVKLLEKFKIIHQTGDSQVFKDFAKLEKIKKNLPENISKRYFLTKYIFPPDVGGVLNLCDLVISRAGINTVCELAAVGKPAILVPLPFARDMEQLRNAKFLAQAGSALILNQQGLTNRKFLSSLDKVVDNLDLFQKKCAKVKTSFPRDGSLKLAKTVVDFLKSSAVR